MTQYDEYFTNDDKPFAENLNDVLLVSNVFDYTIDIEMPKMFSNGNFINNTSSRKCGVSIISLVENSGLTINSNNVNGTGILSFKFYPNFNSFDGITKLDWDCTGTITCKIKNINGTLITNITKGQNINNSNLKPLKEYLIELTFSDATLNKFFIKMTNKSSENRYGANVKVKSVDGLEDRLNSIENDSRWEDTRNPKDNQIMADEDNRIDLNDITGTGFYYTSNDEIISYIDNTPNDLNGKNFYLEVQKGSNGDIKQLMTRYHDGERWIRTKFEENWNDWIGLGKKIHYHEDKVDKVQNSANNIVITDGNKNITVKEKLGNINVDGEIGTESGKIITTDTDGVLIASDSITKSKISDFPTTMTPSSHSHGNITDDGKIGSSANKPLITGTGGVINIGNFGTSANTFCQGNDSRLTDTRNPTVTLVDTNVESQMDLNAYVTQAGLFYFYNSATINRVNNIPLSLGNNAFYLFVERYNNNYVKQTLTRYNDGKIWVRIKNNTDWSVWEELSIVGHTHTKSNITDFSHSHGNITNDGKIGSVSGYIVTTGTNGVLQAVSSITKNKISDFPSTMTPSAHTDSNGNYGKATTSVYGHTKLSSSINSTAEDVSATPKAVKSAYDLANTHIHGNLNNNGTLNSDTDTVNKVIVTNSSNQLKTIQKVPFANLNITKSNITGLGIPSTNTTYSNATTTTAGLMSSTDKSKLDGISTGATKNTIDTALSSTSTNAVQNKVINTALNGKASSTHSHGYINNDGTINTVLPSTQEFEYVLVQESRGGVIYSHNKLSKKLMGLDWKNVPLTNMNGITLDYNDLFCKLKVAMSHTIDKTKINTYYNLVTGTIPSAYRPPNARVGINSGDVFIRIKVTDDGNVQIFSPQSFSSAITVATEIIWSR